MSGQYRGHSWQHTATSWLDACVADLCDHRSLFRDKALSYQARWPWLQIVEETKGLSAPAG